MRLIVLDTETSGFKQPAGVCECAFIELDPSSLEEIGRVHSLIDPEVDIQPSASGVHGITNDMVGDQPTLQEWFEIVLENPFEGEDVLMVAHNSAYDHPFVAPYLGNSRQLCTLRLSRIALPDADDHKLSTLKYTYGLGDKGSRSHGALADVLDCCDLLRVIAGKLNTDIEGLIDIHDAPRMVDKMPFGKHKGVKLTDVPKSYFQWLLKQDNVDSDLRQSIEKIIG